MSLAKWFYRGGRPNRVARVLNRGSAAIHAQGIAPDYLVTLEVPGRRSGRTISLPLVMVVVAGERYLVSMLGDDVNWVRNVRAVQGNVTLRHGRREEVRLEEVAPDRRAPVLKAYLKRAPGARAHLPVERTHRSKSSSGCRPGSPCTGSCRGRRRERVDKAQIRIRDVTVFRRISNDVQPQIGKTPATADKSGQRD